VSIYRKGAIKALSDYGVNPDRELIVEGQYKRDVAYEEAQKTDCFRKAAHGLFCPG